MPAGCAIPEKQNSESSLKHIAAWSFLYGRAKVIAGWQLVFSVPAALAMSVIAMLWPGTKLFTTPLSLLLGWIAMLWLDRVQNERQKLAARVQEKFDCDLFDLPWNKVRCGAPPETEAVNEAAEGYAKTGDAAQRRDWYPVAVGQLPTALARLVCQRAAVWWDMSQRKEYARWLSASIAILVLAVLGLSFAADQRVRDMVFTVYIPVAPAIVWAVREWRRQQDAHAGLEKLMGHVETAFNEGLSAKHDVAELRRFSRCVQDALFDGRSRNPLFFDFIYRQLRRKYEVRMNEKAIEMVADAIARYERWQTVESTLVRQDGASLLPTSAP